MFQRFFQEFQNDLKGFIFWCILFTVFRALFIGFYSFQLTEFHISEVLEALWLGLRLSLKTTGIIMLLSILTATIPKTIAAKWPAIKIRYLVHTLAVVFFTICFFVRIEYYKIFNSAFNMMLINGMHDDIKAIFVTAVNEYQLLWRLPLAILCGLIIAYLFKAYMQLLKNVGFEKICNKKLTVIITLLFLPGMWIFVRYGGAFSYKDSINWENAARLKSNLLNEAVLDDGQALYRVYAMKKKLDAVNNVNISISELKAKITALGGDSNATSIDTAFARTVTAPMLKQQPDNIVLVVGESFGLWPFLPQFTNLHLVDNSLKLAQADNGASVEYMLPNGSGTIAAVNGIVTGLPDTGLYENYQ